MFRLTVLIPSDGDGWVVLLDPAGNEFCMTRSAAERQPAGAPGRSGVG
jgi:hypothetical protein